MGSMNYRLDFLEKTSSSHDVVILGCGVSTYLLVREEMKSRRRRQQ
jgi:hypothetical protein